MTRSIVTLCLEDALDKTTFNNAKFTVRDVEWAKSITGLNKAVDTGYSLQGDFVNKFDLLANQKVGLHLLHDRGDRSSSRYTLFVLKESGQVEILHILETAKKDWAVRLWKPIEQWLVEQKTNSPTRKKDLEEKIARLKAALLKAEYELAELNNEPRPTDVVLGGKNAQAPVECDDFG